MSNKKLKVVWLCHFSNELVHEKLELGYTWLTKLILKMAQKPISTIVPEFGVWNTNGISEFEKVDAVELHIVSPYPHMLKPIQEFAINGIHYHFFRNEEEKLLFRLYRHLFKPKYLHFRENCKAISKAIDRIQPDIVHLIGAENPYYSLGLLNVPKQIVTIAQLQTLLCDPIFKSSYHRDFNSYYYKLGVEKTVLETSNYIGTGASKYKEIILNTIKPDAIILNIDLFLKEPIVIEQIEKQFDFVYFAANISKAADLAIEAFGRAFQSNPNITLDIVGGYDQEYKQQLDDLIHKYGMERAVSFEGSLPSHGDVVAQIRKARFALLPIRVDVTSSTIREAMSCGLPVITTDTGEQGTQILNRVRQNVLISPKGDCQSLADNMIRLIEDSELEDTLRKNSYITRKEADSNEDMAKRYVETYHACVNHSRLGEPLPNRLIFH